MNWELHVRGDHWAELHVHLYGLPGEHGAVLLCGISSSKERTRLLVHEVAIARDDQDYRYVDGVYRLDARFVTRVAMKARKLGLVYIAVHPHGGFDDVEVSRIDIASQLRSSDPLRSATKAAFVGWMVTAPMAARCVLRTETGTIDVERVVILDPHARKVLTPAPRCGAGSTAERWRRQTLIYGDDGQRLLGQTTVGIVGLGVR